MRPVHALTAATFLLAAGLAPVGALPLDVFIEPFGGTHKVVVIPMQFQDVKGVNPPEAIQNLFFAEGGDERSVRDYFLEVSGGRMVLGGIVAPVWVTSQYKMAQYGNSDSGRNPAFNPLFPPLPQCAIALEAARLADPYVDYSQHVDPATGSVRIVVIHAGTAQDMGTTDLDIWSHMWSICDLDWNWGPFYLDGVPLGQYMTDSEFSPIGTNAHELGHLSLAIPDLYLGDNPVQNWDLMASGSWDGHALSEPRDTHAVYAQGGDPAHLGAWSKWSMGWLDPLTVGAVPGGQSIELAPAEGTDGTRAIRLDIDTDVCWTERAGATPWTTQWTPDGDRFFLAEYRNPEAGRYDGDRGPAGIVVWYVDECAHYGWWWGMNSDPADARVSVIGADRSAIPAGGAFSPMSTWSSTVENTRTGWFIEVQETADDKAVVRVGKSAADLRVITPGTSPSLHTAQTTVGLPTVYEHADGESVSAAPPSVMRKDAPVRFFVEGPASWSVVAEGATTVSASCVASSAVTCRFPSSMPAGEYVIRVRVTDGATERRAEYSTHVV